MRCATHDCARIVRFRITSSAAFLCLFLSMPVVHVAKADSPPVTDWIARYSGLGNGNEQVTGMAMDDSGNIYVTGYSSGTWWDIATVKYSPAGDQLAAVRYNGTGGGDDVPQAITVDGNGNVYVTGYTDGNGQYNYDLILIKYNSDLTQQWFRTYAGQNNVDEDKGTDVAVDPVGNVYVTGYSFEGSFDYVTIKYDTAGVRKWVATYDGPNHQSDGANGIVVDDDGSVYITGISPQVTGTNSDVATIKYNTAGVQQWVRRHNGPANGNDSGIGIALDASGNVCVTGYSTGVGTHTDYATIKYTNDGGEEWVRTYNSPINSFDSAFQITVDTDANVYVTGQSLQPGTAADYATIKYNPAGVEQWVAIYNGPVNGYDEGQALTVDADQNVYVTGYSDGGIGAVDYDYATIKYDMSGAQKWVARYDGPGSNIDVAQAVAIDDQGRVVVSGWSTGTQSNYVDFATIKYEQDGATSVQHVEPAIIASTAEPNPFSDQTTIRFDLMQPSAVDLSVFDVNGRKVRTLLSERLGAGTHSTNLPGLGLAPGVYFYELVTTGRVESGKLIRR